MLPNHMKRKKQFSPGTGKFQLTDKTAPAVLISDLHLTPESPETLAYFHHFLGSLGNIDSLYVLGDLFEYWLGDDAYETLGHSPVEDSLRNLTNMDFLSHHTSFLNLNLFWHVDFDDCQTSH